MMRIYLHRSPWSDFLPGYYLSVQMFRRPHAIEGEFRYRFVMTIGFGRNGEMLEDGLHPPWKFYKDVQTCWRNPKNSPVSIPAGRGFSPHSIAVRAFHAKNAGRPEPKTTKRAFCWNY